MDIKTDIKTRDLRLCHARRALALEFLSRWEQQVVMPSRLRDLELERSGRVGLGSASANPKCISLRTIAGREVWMRILGIWQTTTWIDAEF
jgi:hypothetical protein